jgi:hypothetical protein
LKLTFAERAVYWTTLLVGNNAVEALFCVGIVALGLPV